MMPARYEEEPGPYEDPPHQDAVPALTVPTVRDADGGRHWDYRTEILTAAELTDGVTLVTKLSTVAEEDWELAGLYPAADRHVLLLRKSKKMEREARRVGFAPPVR